MTSRTKLFELSSVLVATFVALVTLPFWGMGPAVFLDSERTVISRADSPDGKRVAQVERIVVGGAPSVVVVIRSPWMPNWYLAGCAAASDYQEAAVSVRWISNSEIAVSHTDDRRYWKTGSAPFHSEPCKNLTVIYNQVGH